MLDAGSDEKQVFYFEWPRGVTWVSPLPWQSQCSPCTAQSIRRSGPARSWTSGCSTSSDSHKSLFCMDPALEYQYIWSHRMFEKQISQHPHLASTQSLIHFWSPETQTIVWGGLLSVLYLVFRRPSSRSCFWHPWSKHPSHACLESWLSPLLLWPFLFHNEENILTICFYFSRFCFLTRFGSASFHMNFIFIMHFYFNISPLVGLTGKYDMTFVTLFQA